MWADCAAVILGRLEPSECDTSTALVALRKIVFFQRKEAAAKYIQKKNWRVQYHPPLRTIFVQNRNKRVHNERRRRRRKARTLKKEKQDKWIQASAEFLSSLSISLILFCNL